jgi:oxygen-independent coproporphyrinogen-3 oxidase
MARAAQDEDRAAAMYELAEARLTAAGYAWYEISNWARPGHAARHNLGYWRGSAWEGVGPGAHAFDGATRRWNAARLDGYLDALLPADGRATLPPGGREEREGTRGEKAMLALRTSAGLPKPSLDDPAFGGALRWALDEGLLSESGDRLVLTVRGRLLSNEVFARLV